MIRVQGLSYGVPAKELYSEISFSIEQGQHCALIGSNGTGKSTLADMLMRPAEYLFDGVIEKDEECRTGYASQFVTREKNQEISVFEFLSERFLEVQKKIADVCDEMASAEDMEEVFGRYQELLDLNESMDGDNYESNIIRQLSIAGMLELKDIPVSKISGGEYKNLQIMREMLLAPNLLVLDEPDVFLDFENLNHLAQMINEFKGALLVITHNRYLLNHCFHKILHLENGDLHEFEGSYTLYRCEQLRQTLELKKQHLDEEEEIARTEIMVEKLRKKATILVNPVTGRQVNAKQTQLDRLIARHIDEPFVELRQQHIILPEVEIAEEKSVLTIEDYEVTYDRNILENVSFELMAGEKAAIVGANGTGKTSLVRDILENRHPSIHIDENTKYACLSQLQGETIDGDSSIYKIMLDRDFGNEERMREYLSAFCLEGVDIHQKISSLSVGEQNLFQISMIADSDAELLILDEPTSHLDLFAQMALEKAIAEYRGTVLLISHDFYLIAGCADYVLFIEDNTMRRMRTRKFRKMVYDRFFEQKYLEIDRKKQEIENEITAAYREKRLDAVEKLCDQLEKLG